MKKKQIVTGLMLACILMIVGKTNIIDVLAEEVIIESISGKEENPWENRPLIQTTSFEDEYLGSVRLGAFTMPVSETEDAEKMYEEASKCVVRIVMRQYAGSGLIWRFEEEGMVLVSNRHLLREAAYGTVTFINGDELQAEVLGFSQAYDIGFLFISREALTSDVLRECYQVRLYESLSENMHSGILADIQVAQIGSAQGVAADRSKGQLIGKEYVPEFQNDMLVTKCYARAGMSGGGVYDEKGRLLGMIAGGDVDNYNMVRDSQITYSISVEDIEEVYESVMDNIVPFKH